MTSWPIVAEFCAVGRILAVKSSVAEELDLAPWKESNGVGRRKEFCGFFGGFRSEKLEWREVVENPNGAAVRGDD
jgi:hypothetical protein